MLNRFLMLAVAITLMTVNTSIAAESPKVQFLNTKKPTIAFKQAEEDKKFILLFFTDPMCSFCKQMESTTFKDKRVVNLIGSTAIAISTEFSSDNSKAWKELYPTNAIPTQHLLDSSGTVISTHVGRLYPEDEIIWLLIHTNLPRNQLEKYEKKVLTSLSGKPQTSLSLAELRLASALAYMRQDKAQAYELYGESIVPRLMENDNKKDYVNFWAYTLHDNYESASKVQQIITTTDKSLINYKRLAFCYAGMRCYDKAIESISEAIKYNPGDEDLKQIMSLYSIMQRGNANLPLPKAE